MAPIPAASKETVNIRNWAGFPKVSARSEATAAAFAPFEDFSWFKLSSFFGGTITLDHALECAQQIWPRVPQFLLVVERKLTQQLVSLGSQCQQYLPPVSVTLMTLYQTARCQTIRKFDGTMVLNLQAFGQFADARPHIFWQPLQSQQKLVLPWFKAGLPRRLLAEA
jgi:hypothetical protein